METVSFLYFKFLVIGFHESCKGWIFDVREGKEKNRFRILSVYHGRTPTGNDLLFVICISLFLE